MRALFSPLATPDFVHPAIAAARALQRRGHAVAFATGRGFAETLRQIAIERIPCGKLDAPSFHVETWSDASQIALQVKHIEFAIDRFAPDVLVSHPLALGPLIARERAGLPLAVLGLGTHLWPSSDALSGAHWFSETEKRRWWRHGDVMGYFNQARRLFKIAPIDVSPAESPLLGDLLMLQSVREIADPHGELPERVHLVGAGLWEPPPSDELRDWLETVSASGQPLIYLHHGRSFELPSFWQKAVEALGDSPVRVAAAIGRMDRSAPLIPPSFFVRPHLSQEAVLREARMVISGGDTTAVLGALTHGLPSVLLPGGGEQSDLAEEVTRAGAAVTLSITGLTAEIVRDAVDYVLSNAELTLRARALGRSFSRLGGPGQAACLIEQIAASRRPALRRTA